MKLASPFSRGRIVALAMSIALTIAAVDGQVVAQQPAGRIDRELIRETVESLASVVNREYFDAGVGARVDASLRQWLSEGRYADAGTLESLAGMLTRDLLATTEDKHLAVRIVPDAIPGPAASQAPDTSRELGARRANFGIQRVEILAGNVGYLNVTSFYRPEEARDAIAAAMRTLRYADALILDMRGNSGGSPDTAALLASYLFDAADLPLFEIVPRSGTGRRYATESPGLPERNGTRPVYVLTAARTFSAGEGLAFILQERRRAEVVGESTAGAANPGRPYPVNARFEVTVPNGQVRTAVTGRNWEGTGVIPDVKVAGSDALRVGHIRALRGLLERTPSGPWHDTLRRHLDALER
jgi:Peptidase family S41/N-terminal domain of Peptidase_S41 in eukaryotic IRBP